MKKRLHKFMLCLVILISTLLLNKSDAQVCVFAGEECCGEGITNFQLNGNPAINRNSTVNENGGFTNTTLTTTVIKGSTYNYSVTFPLEDNIVNCNTFNFKIYIDYNQNNLLTDSGETVATLSNVTNGTYTGSFTIPTTALTGNAYMRVMMKMAATSLSGGSCGHTPITPCNSPADPIGFHGEVENYTLNITSGTDITNYSNASSNILVYPNPASDFIKFSLDTKEKSVVEIYSAVGEKLISKQIKNGESISINSLASGLYYVKMIPENNNSVIQKIQLLK